MINYGKDYGKLVVIVDIIDQSRVSLSRPFVHSVFFLPFSSFHAFRPRLSLSLSLPYGVLLQPSFATFAFRIVCVETSLWKVKRD